MSAKEKIGLTNKIINFIQDDLWRIRLHLLSKPKQFGLRYIRVVALAFRHFSEDKGKLQAASLTFYSLLSVVPMAAMAFGIAKGFGLEALLEKLILERMQGQEVAAQQIIEFSHSFLEKTQGGVIAGVGVAILFWTVIKVLTNVEKTFNEIWEVKNERSLSQKFSDYLSIMLICPILLIVSSSATVVIASQIKLLLEKFIVWGPLGQIVFASLNMLPYCVLWVLFTFIYKFIPNTKVTWLSGLTGGVLAGTIYQVVQWLYINFQIGVSQYGAVYGSFAALPLFLVWLQLSWLVVIFGAEIAHAVEDVDSYEFEKEVGRSSHSYKRFMLLVVTQLCVKRFQLGEKPWTEKELVARLDAPVRSVRLALQNAVDLGLLAEVIVNRDIHQIGYQPAKDIDALTLQDIIYRFEHRGEEKLPLIEDDEIRLLKQRHQEIEKEQENNFSKISFRSKPLL